MLFDPSVRDYQRTSRYQGVTEFISTKPLLGCQAASETASAGLDLLREVQSSWQQSRGGTGRATNKGCDELIITFCVLNQQRSFRHLQIASSTV
ncbi:hypothetical protein RRG08_039395 [Elysia crispata]|uniref:Uncharacterized protein n=1 Tax=Elysia crispata TaxID=231223 RepID=A0AAE0XVL8_9GAST|nr:hypothetical protein RRG08_039395 [Elysia crispata]